MLTGVLEKKRLEIGATSGQDHLVGFNGMSIAGECHIHERFTLQQLIEDVRQVRLVVVPSEAELLRRSGRVLHFGGGGDDSLIVMSVYLKVPISTVSHKKHHRQRTTVDTWTRVTRGERSCTRANGSSETDGVSGRRVSASCARPTPTMVLDRPPGPPIHPQDRVAITTRLIMRNPSTPERSNPKLPHFFKNAAFATRAKITERKTAHYGQTAQRTNKH